MDIKKQINKAIDWYSLPSVRYEMIRFLQKRELAMIVPSWATEEQRKRTVRNLRCHNQQSLKFIIKALRMQKQETPYNFYYSVGKYSQGLPFGNLLLKERDMSEWNRMHYKEMQGYDFVIDIDAPTDKEIPMAHTDALTIVGFLNLWKCPHEIRFSGRGFHLSIPYEYLQPEIQKRIGTGYHSPHNEENIYKLYARLAKFFYTRVSEFVDKTIYDSRRVLKIPYSLALYDGSIRVCWPMKTIKEFKNFGWEKCIPENKSCEVIRRGKTLFNENGNVAELFKKCLQEE